MKTQSVKLEERKKSSFLERERESQRYPAPARPVPKSLLARRTAILAPRRLDKRLKKKKKSREKRKKSEKERIPVLFESFFPFAKIKHRRCEKLC